MKYHGVSESVRKGVLSFVPGRLKGGEVTGFRG